MSNCPNRNEFTKYIRRIRQSVEIDKNKDKRLRYNVWKTTADHIKELFATGSSSILPQEDNSLKIMTKVDNALKRINESTEQVPEFIKEIIDSDHNIEMSIALHEIMESGKGEADKARNEGVRSFTEL